MHLTCFNAHPLIGLQSCRNHFPFYLQSTIHEHLVHVLPTKHVVDVAPALFIIVEIVDADRLAKLPVSVDNFLLNN
jgi:hypothetical protein